MHIRIPGLIFALFTLLISFNAAAEFKEGATLYVQTNIWYEKPMKIIATNYHVGSILAVGTKVTMEEISKKRIIFTDENGQKYRIIIKLKHNNVPGPKLAGRLFSETNVKDKGGKFHSFSKDDQENIIAGYVSKGMSKEAVLMAYGYPPTIRTPSTEGNIWTYWKNRWVTQIIRFKDGKVSEIQG